MKMRTVIENEKCFEKDLYSNFSEKKGKNYYNGIVIRELFKKFGLQYNNKDVIQIVKDTIPEELFHTSRESIINTSLLVLRLLRFQEYCSKYSSFGIAIQSGATVHKGGVAFVTKNSIEVDYSFIVEDGDNVTIVKVKNKKPDLKQSGKTVHTKTSENMELFLLQLAAEKVVPNKGNYTAKIAFLRHEQDQSNTLVPAITYSMSKNVVVSANFFGSHRDGMFQRVEDAINGKSKHSCTNCSECAYYRLCQYQKDNTNLCVMQKQAKANNNVTFTKSQQEMIRVTSGIYRVLAGAGSGKTTCIANRICNLIKNGVDSQDILLITYTTKGVQEMKEKIEYWLKVNNVTNVDVKKMNIFTFNSFGFELLKKEYQSYGYTTEPNLLEKSEKIALIKQLLDAKPEIPGFNYKDPVLDMPYAKGVVLMMDKYFSIIKQGNLIYPEQVMKECYIKNKDVATTILELYSEYKNHMMQNNLVDYADQVNLCYEILCDKGNLEKYGFGYVMVDEFQDSDNLQIHILMELAKFSGFISLMVVGDDSQAIFSWRGATANNIIHFADVFPNSYDINLMENFRSSTEICELANKINDINHEKVPKQLISTRSNVAPMLCEATNPTEFVDRVVEVMLYYGYNFSDICLIARNKKDLIEIQQELVSRNLTSLMSVNELLIDNPIIQHLIDFAKFLLDSSATLSFAEYLQVADWQNYSKQTKSSFQNYVETAIIDFETEMANCNNEEDKIAVILNRFDKIAQTERSVKSLLEILKSRRFHTVSELAQFMVDMETYKADYTIEKFDEPVNAITLTTAHSSKGREWTFVAIYLPSFSYPSTLEYNAVKNNPEYEEERRLLFVAITRAKDILLLGGKTHDSVYKEVSKALQDAKRTLKI